MIRVNPGHRGRGGGQPDGRQPGYDGADLSICETLYAANAADAPYFAYHHSDQVVPNDGCPTGSSSTAGLDFQFSNGNSYPAEYQDALFFADYSRDCIWVMPKGTNGLPAPGQIKTFVAGAANPVNLEIGPGGDLFSVDFDGGTIHRVRYFSANRPPVAVATASPTTGPAPLTVASTKPTRTSMASGSYAAKLRVTDPAGLSATVTVTVTVGNTPPTAATYTARSRH